MDAKTSLEDAGVSVGKKTSRERLLELLDRHIHPKKPWLSRQKGRIPSKKDLQSGKHQKKLPVTNDLHFNKDKDINYNIYHESQHVEMLQAIGVDTRGLDKEALVKSCQTHSDLRMWSFCSLILLDYPWYSVIKCVHVSQSVILPDLSNPIHHQGPSECQYRMPNRLMSINKVFQGLLILLLFWKFRRNLDSKAKFVSRRSRLYFHLSSNLINFYQDSD